METVYSVLLGAKLLRNSSSVGGKEVGKKGGREGGREGGR